MGLWLLKWLICGNELKKLKELENELEELKSKASADRKKYESKANYWYNEAKILQRRNDCLSKIAKDADRKLAKRAKGEELWKLKKLYYELFVLDRKKTITFEVKDIISRLKKLDKKVAAEFEDWIAGKTIFDNNRVFASDCEAFFFYKLTGRLPEKE